MGRELGAMIYQLVGNEELIYQWVWNEELLYCSGLAGEIDRPQVLFYPLIESSNIPRYN